MMTEQTKDIAAVNRLSEDYTAAWAKGDPELLLDGYADDAVVIMSHEDPIGAWKVALMMATRGEDPVAGIQ